jgi:hypothetical protein
MISHYVIIVKKSDNNKETNFLKLKKINNIPEEL